MTLPLMDLYFIMIFLIIYIEAGLNPEEDNVCLKTITYNETITVTLNRPASKRDTVKCLKERRNCDEKITIATREPQVIIRTKIVPSCCEGYEEDPKGTQCVPICPKGCGNGRCEAPGKCVCETGFSGPECVKMCDEGRWGENCFFECDCSENEVCDKISGCECKPGWMGERCATPCPEGYYGFLCQEKCPCDFHLCDHITGTCIKPKENMKTHFIKEGNGTPQEQLKTLPNAGIAKEKTVDEAEDFELSESNTLTTTLENEIFDERVAAGSKKGAAVTTKSPNFKYDNIDGNSNQSLVVDNPSTAQERNLQPVKNAEEPTKPAVFNIPDITESLDVLKELMNTTASRNELLNPDSDKQMTPVGSVQNSRVENFIPTFTVLSGVTVLIILIAGKWLIITIQKKIKKMTNVELGCFDEELSILSSEKSTWENNLVNPAYAPDVLKAVPTLQTFKPLTAENESQKIKKSYLQPRKHGIITQL